MNDNLHHLLRNFWHTQLGFNFSGSFLKRKRILGLLASLGLITALSLPVLSQSEPVEPLKPVQLAQQGRELYEAGKLEQAIKTWQQAAVAYETAGNSEGMTESFLNTATAQQALGIYSQSCDTLLQAFDLDKKQTDCPSLLQEAQSRESNLIGGDLAGQSKSVTSITAIDYIAKQPDSLNKATGLLRFGDYLRESGYPRVASRVLKRSLETAEKLGEPRTKTAALISLGNTERDLAKRQQNQFPPQTVAVGTISGQLNLAESERNFSQAALRKYQPALEYYRQAATETPSELNGLKAELNELSFLLDTWEFWQEATTEVINNSSRLGITDREFLAKVQQGAVTLQYQLSQDLQPQIVSLTTHIEPQISNLPTNRTGIYGRINFAESLIRQGRTDRQTVNILTTALQQARQTKSVTGEAEALGYLGSLYEKEAKYPEARRLTEIALQTVPATEYPEISYRWHAQLGRILVAQNPNQRPQALSAYEASFNTIQALRSDLATTPVEPIFREYIKLLLVEKPTASELEKARDVLESLQVVKLDNFFRDPCSQVADEPVIIDNVDPHAAVIYPILLEDSLEVIVTLPGKPLVHYSTKEQNIGREDVETTIDKLRRRSLINPGFAEAIRGARGNEQQVQIAQNSQKESIQNDILPLAGDLYDWLLKPITNELTANKVNTLVFVLDGSLRNIPMALLYDRNDGKYLIQKDYNIALSSGLQLTNPQPLQRQSIKVLAAGVSKEYQDFPPLPKVRDELAQIKQTFKNSEILLDDRFTQDSLRQKLRESDYPVVHLATHGQFGSTSDRTFILSGANKDALINVNQFDDLLRSRNERSSQPIELLVLSACNTAQGDERAILGLAGVAVRAGARSTLATLWGANDEATAELMSTFYDTLAANTNISKAKALRSAQLSLLEKPNSQYNHPYYWAPFVLIGNWL
jgi:CHAT domain-containing protein